MSALEQLNKKLSTMNVTLAELPERGKRKYTALSDLLKSRLKTIRDAEGKLKPNSLAKAQDLTQDIMEIAYAYKEERDSTPPPPNGDDTPPPNGDDTPPPPPPNGDDTPPPPKPKKSGGLSDTVLGIFG